MAEKKFFATAVVAASATAAANSTGEGTSRR